MAASTITPLTTMPSASGDVGGSYLAAGLTLRLSVALTSQGEDTLSLIRLNDSNYWEETGITLPVKRGPDAINASSSVEVPIHNADKYHVVSRTGLALSAGVVKLNSLQPPSGLASVPGHGATHTSIGSDPIPLAVPGGASGLMSGDQAEQLAQLSGGVPGETQVFSTSVPDSGAAAIAYKSNNTVALTAGRLWSERNNDVEKFAIRFDGGVIAPTIGPVYTQQHTLPAVASDTVALLAAAQTLASKTLTAPVINGLTSSGATANDFSGSTGVFKTSTGACTIGGGAAAIGITSSGAAITITAGLASTWSTSAGALTASGFAGINLQVNGTTVCDVGATNANKLTLAANKSLSGAAGTGGLDCGSMTGVTQLPTGNLGWAGAAGATVSIVGDSTITLTAGAASTWKTTGGALNLDGFGGINLKLNTATKLDVGVTDASKVTLAAGISLSAAAGATGLDLGAATGASVFPTGAFSWTGAAAAAMTLAASGAAINITADAASLWRTTTGGLTITSAAAATWSTAAGALTLTSAAAAVWSTAAGTLTVSGFAGLVLQVNGTTVLDVGATAANDATLAANKNLKCAAGTTAVDLSLGTGAFKPPTGLFTFQGKQAATATANAITDPGNAGAIPVTSDGVCAMTSAGAETRTLAIPTFVGQRLSLICDTYVGNIVITSAQAINQAGNTTLTFGAAADFIELVACTVGGALRWRVAANDGVALS